MVVLTADHGFRIGMPHINLGLPCQDYALSGVLKTGVAYAVVADGCSSGRHTDIGARVIVRACVPDELSGYLAGDASLETLPADVRRSQQMAMRVTIPVLKLELEDLLATSVLAIVTPQDGGMVYLRGDGAIALGHADGRTEVYTFEPEQNAPIYPAYVLDNYRGVQGRFGTDDTVPSLGWKHYVLTDAEPELLGTGVLTLAEACEGFSLTLTPDDVADLRYVAVFTDGVMQVTQVPWHDVVRQLLAFKGVAGKFVTRRLNRFMDTAAQSGKGLGDDLGYAVILIAPDPQPEEGV